MNKNELNELSKKLKQCEEKDEQKIWYINLVFLMEQNNFLKEYFEVI